MKNKNFVLSLITTAIIYTPFMASAEMTLENNRFNTEEITMEIGAPRWFAEDASTYVVTLGTATPSPTPYRFGAAGAVIVDEHPYLIDAGSGVVKAIAKAAISHNKKLLNSFHPQKLNTLFITHLHSDHTIGLPDLILTPWIFGRTKPMEIYGPVGTQKLVDGIISGYQEDIRERIEVEGNNATGIKINVHEISKDGLVLNDGNVKVSAYSHHHGDLSNYAYKFESKDKVIFWAGDGQGGDNYQKAAKNSDVLISEIASEKYIHNSPWGGMSDEQIEEVVWNYHIKPTELADLAKKAGIKTVVLQHESNYSKPYALGATLSEFKEHYKGNAHSARDGDVFN